ncbi:fibrocystin isoform X6 [Homo sapiens]|uniref:fibrocystin isoform X6 n=1 Tax=Homo sapiens TaxID=9606 RepID=UPI0005D028FC|nr:fibrocystin isoform X6 [Homo sapiens]|eukprot:XP_011512985.1 fibrocystin isoform X6 [Homo sapiens]
MTAWLISLMSIEVLLLAVRHLSLHIEPEEGSLAGGTWITVIFDGLELGVLYPNNGSQLEIHLVNVNMVVPALRSVPCDVFPVFLDLPVVTCRTRSVLSEAHEGLYFLEAYFGGQLVSSPNPGPRDSCTFKFSKAQTPIVHQVYPPSGVPGKLIHVYGWIITGRLETFDFDAEYIDSPVILEAQGDKWVTPCSLINRQMGSCYPIQEDHGLGTLQCHVEGDYIGSQNVSFSVFNKGKSMVHKKAWLISAKQDLFLYQTHSEILSVFPETGSLGGRTNITITGDFFDNSAQVTIAGIPCDIRHVSPRKIECTTRAPGKDVRLTTPQPGNRGLLFEVGDAVEGLELTEATPGYRWQIVPNASSPFGFWSQEGQPFRARLSGFFVAPETNNYTFWIQADSQASLHFSWSEEPRTKVKVASISVGTADWFDSWEQNRDEGTWQQKTPKLELLGGAMYYLEAEHHGIAPSRGMRIGVQIHNTWLNPDVVTTYLREKHQIRVRAQRLPEVQVLNVSGRGNFFLTWDNVSSQPIPANATAHLIQTTIEELLAVKCKLEPLWSNILLRLGFERGPEVSNSDGDLTSGTEPFCGRFSLRQPRHLVLTPPAAQKGYRLDQYTHLCLAYKGHMNKILKMIVSFTIGFQNMVKNTTCDWSLTRTSPESWQFDCTDLWETCVRCFGDLQPPPANSPVLVHQINLLPLAQETGLFYVDEIIIADTNVTVSQADSGTARPGGNLVESVSVVGSPPVYSVTSWLAGCGTELPLITARSVPTEGTEEGSGLVLVTTQRRQRTSPPLGGHFRIQLPNTVISDVPVQISAHHLHQLLQNNADDFTSRYLNASDFTVKEDLYTCYEHVWTLSWSTQIGDLPNFIRVSDENLTGVNPAAATRVVYDGGVFLGPIFGDMLATANQHTQVVVRVNDVPAHCPGSCSFQYLQGSTPCVHSVWYSIDGDINLMIYITGTGFSGDSQFLQVTVNKTSCKVIFSNQTNVVCQTDLLPVGMHRILMLVRPSGLAISATGEDLFLNVKPRLDMVEPSRAADIGGLWATIRGSSLEGVSLILFGSYSCAINVATSNSSRIQCKVPPRGKDGRIVNVTVIRGDYSAVLPRAFTYVSSLNPVIVTLSRNISNIAGGETLVIGVARLMNYTDLDVEVHVQDALAPVHTQSAWGLEVALPPLPAGLHRISVSINGVSIHSQGVDLHIQYLTEVFSIEPCCGSLLGGTILSISGIGFSRDPALVWVLVGNRSCDIVNLTEASIWCETLPAPQIPDAGAPTVPAAVEVWAGNRFFARGPSPSLVGKGFTFMYEAAATPVVTAMQGEITNSSLSLHVGGSNLSNSVILLGNLNCDVETQSFQGNVSLSGCSIPLHSLEAGIYPLQNFSLHGGSLLTIEGTGLRGQNTTSVYIDQQTCLTVNIGAELIRCIVPTGNGSVALEIEVDGLWYHIGVIGYNKAFTPELISISQSDDILTFAVAQISGAANIDIFIGMSPCVGVSGNHTVLQCVVPSLPAGEYHVRGYDCIRGWASSALVFTSRVIITAVTENFGCLGGRLVHVFGAGFSPGNVSAAVCGAPCRVLANATVSAFSCLVLPLDVSLAFLCGLKREEDSCEAARHTYVQCDLTVAMATEQLLESWPYLYICEESSQCLFVPDHWAESMFPSFSGLFISPKLERDEVLIYNSSCNITMETEAEMECETPNQPITVKITEIRKRWGQNTQGNFSLQFCRRWSRTHSWFPERLPQDGDNVTVENGQLLLLDTNTSILNLLHIKGGKLIFMAPGPIELRAHAILVSDGGELRIGSEDKPFQGRAQITLYGSSYSTPFFPYGVKFLAVRNGTLSLHGSLPEVIVTCLRATAHALDTVLALEDAVDWNPGDEVVIISGTGVKGAKPMEEIVTVETVQDTDLYLKSPLRYSHNFTENWVAGEHHILKATVALLSRSITIQGNLTNEREKLLVSCQEANAPEGNLQHCLYSMSEKMLGSRDMGARVIVQSFPEEPSQVQLKGVQFQVLGQAFHKHLSSLTLVGAMRESFIQGCTVRNSFSRGLSMCGTLGLKVDSNVFYNILGHALLVGTCTEMRYISWEAIHGRKDDWSGHGNIIRNNVIIQVSGAEGLSNPEMLTPSGIYICSPTNVIEGNRVCGAGYGYFFHLMTNQTSQAPLLSFTQNIAHSCTRYGLFVYPKFQPPWDNVTGTTLFQSFTVWESAGGAQIFRSSNLRLKNFKVYSCRDFGIDVLESDANTSVTDSLLLGHFAHKGSLCMSSGIKTPKRWELMVSNTTFVNFDLINCVAIRTCSDCSQGQGGFTVKTSQLKFTNSSNLVAFPFPHAAILEDLDGSLSGKNRSHILASMETLSASCLVNSSFGRVVHGSACGGGVLFHRMSIGLANTPEVSYDLTMTDSRNKTTTVNYVRDTLSNPRGWMALLLDQETYSLQSENLWINRSLQYSATFDNFAPGNYLLLVHTDLPPYPDILLRCGSRVGLSFPFLPSPGQNQGCDWFFNSQLRQLTYLVSGEGQVQVILRVKEGMPPTISASTSAPESALKWSLPETWQGVEEGWGGYNNTIPGPGDDVLILPNRTVLVDTDLPFFKGLYVMGTLDFPVDRSNVLSVACMVIAGGELKVGTLENPLEKEQKLLILLRASEGVFCDRMNGIHIDPGTIGVYGKVHLYSAYPKNSWTHLGADIASGNERIIVEDAVDWRPHDKIVLSSSSYEPHEAEVLTVKEVKGHHVRIYERLKHRHIGSVHVTEDGRHIRLAAEVGLLTRNIQIQPDVSCRGRLFVGSFRKSSREEFSGVLQLLNVEIQNFGSPLYSSVEFSNVSAGSWIISSTLHQSCGGGIHAAASHGVLLNDNIVFGTAGHGIDLEGQAYTVTNNLVVLMTQPAWSTIWVAGIKVNQVKDINLHGNVVAGSERLGFHIRGHKCSSCELLWSDNVAHSSLHGLHLYKESGLDNCTRISGFLAFKNFDYGAMLHVENSVEIENITLVDNTIGLLAVVYVFSAPQNSVKKVQIVLRNSVIVATSSSFDCIQDKVKPHSANLTSTDRAPSNPRGGRIGILWPVFTSEPNQWPQEPWHKVRNDHSISGIMKLQDVTFSSFVKSCYSDDLDVCILPNAENSGIMHPITAERTRMLKIKDKNKFYFPSLQPRKDLGKVVCPELDCASPRKYLFKDLDGRALGLPPPVSVFPKTEAEWTASFFNAGTFREEQKCTYQFLMQGFICKQTDQVVLILDSADAIWAIQKLYPVVSVTSGFVDVFSSVNANIPCSTSGSVSTFYSILPIRQITKVCFMDQTPQVLRFFLLGNKSTSKLLLAVFYHELQSPHVFLGESFIPPTLVQSASLLLNESIGANYFNIMDNLLYVVLQGEEPIEIRSGVSIHLALTVMVSVLEKGWEIVILERLTNFLQIGQNQIRFIHEMPGHEETLKAIADSRAKRKRNCPTVTCTSHYRRVGQRRPLMMEMNSHRASPPMTVETISKVIVIEIGDSPTVRSTGMISSLSSNKLQNLAHRVITAQQTGVLENVLNMTIGALLVTQSKGVIGYGNTSSFKTGNLIYIRPYALSILVQPSDGEVGNELPVQPQLVFLDEQNRRVESLGPPSEPWTISASLEGASDSVLKGCTQAETQDGYVSFYNLAVLISGSNWHFIFTVTSPPGVNFTARSKPFAVLPVTRKEKSTIILAASLSSVASWLALSCLVCCWLKRSKSRKTKPEEIPESQTNNQNIHIHISSKRRESQGPKKEDTVVGEDMRMKVMLGKVNQCPHQLMNGVSRRKVSRHIVREEEAAVPAPGTTGITSHGHICAPGAPAQQVYLQETGNWKEGQEQLLRYQLAGQNQLLLLCPDFRQERQQLPGQSRLSKQSGSLGLSQEKKASCGATEAFCLHSVHPETIQEQL